MVVLPYGRVPYALDLGDRSLSVVHPPPPPPRRQDVGELLGRALDVPIGRPRLESMVGAHTRITLIVSDATRAEPRAELVNAIRRRVPRARWTLAVATGTHGPSGLVGLDLPRDLLAEATIVDHDGESDLVDLGTTSRGTPVRVHRCVVDTDLVIATGCVRPHYFAGFGAGVKAIFPGLGGSREVRINHLLKRDPLARAGNVETNPCRLDLEEAVSFVPVPTFLLNGVCASDDAVHGAVAGDPVAAFRAGVELARPWLTVSVEPAAIVIASDRLPVTGSLYQSAKIAAAVAPLVSAGGLLVLVAECSDGIAPGSTRHALETVNEAIFRIGVLPRLASDVRIALVSALAARDVAATLLDHAPSVRAAVDARSGPILVVPEATHMLFNVQ